MIFCFLALDLAIAKLIERIDMTKIKMSGWGWLYLTVVLDWYTKEIVGYSLGLQSRTEDWYFNKEPVLT
jgi:hypothetical protein